TAREFAQRPQRAAAAPRVEAGAGPARQRRRQRHLGDGNEAEADPDAIETLRARVERGGPERGGVIDGGGGELTGERPGLRGGRVRPPRAGGSRPLARPGAASRRRARERATRRRGAASRLGRRAVGPPPGRPSYFLPSTVSFKLLARRNLHTRLAGILMGSPVCGLRPMRAFRFASTSLPKPGSTNAPAFFASRDARASVSSRTPSICFLVSVVFSARWASVADFVIVFATGASYRAW